MQSSFGHIGRGGSNPPLAMQKFTFSIQGALDVIWEQAEARFLFQHFLILKYTIARLHVRTKSESPPPKSERDASASAKPAQKRRKEKPAAETPAVETPAAAAQQKQKYDMWGTGLSRAAAEKPAAAAEKPAAERPAAAAEKPAAERPAAATEKPATFEEEDAAKVSSLEDKHDGFGLFRPKAGATDDDLRAWARALLGSGELEPKTVIAPASQLEARQGGELASSPQDEMGAGEAGRDAASSPQPGERIGASAKRAAAESNFITPEKTVKQWDLPAGTPPAPVGESARGPKWAKFIRSLSSVKQRRAKTEKAPPEILSNIAAYGDDCREYTSLHRRGISINALRPSVSCW